MEVLSKFDALLHCLRKDIEFKNVEFLVRAASVAVRVDNVRKNRFVELIDRWWKQVESRPADEVQIPLLFNSLGRLDVDSCGLVLRKLGNEKFLDVSIDRWLDAGFDLRRIAIGLQGLRDLMGVGRNTKTRIAKEKLHRFDDLLSAIDRFCTDQKVIAIRDCPSAIDTLNAFRHLDVRPPSNTLRSLNEWSLIYFESFGSRHSPDTPQKAMKSLATYADSWLYWRLDPDTLKSNSIRHWFDACARVLNHCKRTGETIQLHALSYLLSITFKFRKIADLIDIFPLWHEAVTKTCNAHSNPKNLRGAPNLVLWIGLLLAEYRPRSDLPKDIVDQLEIIADSVMAAMSKTDPSSLSFSPLSELVTGYKNIKETTKGGGLLPEHVSSFLRQWFIIWRQREGFRSSASDAASTIFLLLARGHLNAPESMLEELSKTYFWGLAHSSRQLALLLWRYGVSCYIFSYDPSRNAALGERVWAAWFRHAQECLESRGEEEDRHLRKLLSTIVDVAAAFERSDEFARIQPTWERGVLENLPSFTEVTLRTMERSVQKLQKDQGVQIDPKIIDGLKKAESKKETVSE